MAKTRETPHLTTPDIVTGHFRERRGYATWRPHGTNDWLLIYTAGGKGRFGYVGGELLTAPGDIVVLRPGALHDYGVEPTLERWQLLWAHFQPRAHWLPWLHWPEPAPGLLRLQLGRKAVAKSVERRLGDMHRLAQSAARRRTDLAMNALEDVLLRCDSVNPAHAMARMDDRIRAAMDFLCRNMTRKILLTEVAAHSALSVSRLAHLFREQVGSTPQQFLEMQRLNRARELLEFTPHSIKEIAYQLGFDNPFYFTLRFKRFVGLSPRDFRNRLAARDAK